METYRILREQWIWAKYQREEFIFPEKQRYTRGTMVELLNYRSIFLSLFLAKQQWNTVTS